MISYSSFSRAGGRSVNEDAVGATACGGRHLFVVADGLGGHGHGKAASSYVVSRLLHMFAGACGQPSAQFLNETLRMIQMELADMQLAEQCPAGLRSTVVAAVVSDAAITIAHVGDSRGYVLGPWGVQRRTLDHSVPQMLALAGEIKEKDIRRHPSRSQLLHALGDGDEDLRLDILEVKRSRRTKALLLCSDGFWEHIDERRMCATRRQSETPQEWLETMEKIVLEEGKDRHMDNYSALGVFME